MRIQVKESSVVRPSSATPHTRIAIAILDYLFPPNYHSSAMYLYRYNGATNFLDTTVLKASLSDALVHFYPMAGRLQRNGDSLEINCNEEGVVFVVADCDGEMDELDDFSPRVDGSFVPTVDYSGGISTVPLFLAQVTRFRCGGVCLAVRTEHHVVDGSAALHFLISWSEIARGLPISIPPFLDRTSALKARTPPQPKFSHIEYQQPPTLITPPSPHKNQTLTFKNLKLSRDQINALKEKCKETIPNCTTYEVVTGHGWYCICKARNLPLHQETKLQITVDGRSRLQPPLPLGYFGNVLFAATPIASVGEISSNPLSYSVDKVHKAIARMDDEYLRSALDYLELIPDVTPILPGEHSYNCPNIGVISWAKLPYPKVDFGWGSPMYLGPASLPFEGKCYVTVNPNEEGGLLYALALPEDQMQLFQKLFYDI